MDKEIGECCGGRERWRRLLGNVSRSRNRSDDLDRYKPIDSIDRTNKRDGQQQRFDAIRHDAELARGVNVLGGHVTYEAVAEANGLDYTPLDDALAAAVL